uniref:Uncharacterized protein n=1 Tax=Oryza glumipatula TaxID=40148 RepID=A0A0D9YDS0_9ORYZ
MTPPPRLLALRLPTLPRSRPPSSSHVSPPSRLLLHRVADGSMSSSSSRGPGWLSTAPSQIQPSLIPDSPIPTAPSQRRGGVVAREMTGGESEEGEADGNPPSVTLALQSPFTVEPCVVAFPRRCHHIKAPHAWSSFPEAGRNGRSLAKAPSRSGQLPQQQRVHGLLHCSVRGSGLFCQRGHCLIHHRRGFFPFPKCTTYLPLRNFFFSNEIDRIPMAVATRTGKPSLDMFLAEMRRFEVLPSAVKNCWNVTSLLLLARSLLLAPVYCHRAAASSPEPLSSPSAAGAEKLIFLLSWLYFLSSHLTFTSRNEMMADYLLDHCDVPLRFKDMHKSKINMLPRSKLLTLWPTGDFGKILSCFTMAFHCLAHGFGDCSGASDLNVDLADWRMASRRSFRDYLRKVFGTLFFFRDCLSKFSLVTSKKSQSGGRQASW